MSAPGKHDSSSANRHDGENDFATTFLRMVQQHEYFFLSVQRPDLRESRNGFRILSCFLESRLFLGKSSRSDLPLQSSLRETACNPSPCRRRGRVFAVSSISYWGQWMVRRKKKFESVLRFIFSPPFHFSSKRDSILTPSPPFRQHIRSNTPTLWKFRAGI